MQKNDYFLSTPSLLPSSSTVFSSLFKASVSFFIFAVLYFASLILTSAVFSCFDNSWNSFYNSSSDFGLLLSDWPALRKTDNNANIKSLFILFLIKKFLLKVVLKTYQLW